LANELRPRKERNTARKEAKYNVSRKAERIKLEIMLKMLREYGKVAHYIIT